MAQLKYWDGTAWVDAIVGAQGIQGVQGTQGNQGVQGTQGPQGTQGVQGTQGTQGVQGTQGTQGTQGLEALWNFTGEWVNGIDYGPGDLVTYNGSLYYTATGVYSSYYPGYVGVDWVLAASKGDAGAQGTQGIQGIQGIQGTQGTQGIQGELGTQGTQGTQGTTGVQGAEGSFGGVAFEYNYSSTTTMADPGNTYIRLNAAPASATHLAIDDINSASADIHSYLQTIDDSTSAIKGHVKISLKSNSAVFAMYAINSLVDNATYFDIDITYLSGSGSFTNEDDVILTFARTGDVGAQGTQGTQGFTGAQGATGTQGLQGTQGIQGFIGEEGIVAQTSAPTNTDILWLDTDEPAVTPTAVYDTDQAVISMQVFG